jgi:hypothetical protein
MGTLLSLARGRAYSRTLPLFAHDVRAATRRDFDMRVFAEIKSGERRFVTCHFGAAAQFPAYSYAACLGLGTSFSVHQLDDGQ